MDSSAWGTNLSGPVRLLYTWDDSPPPASKCPAMIRLCEHWRTLYHTCDTSSICIYIYTYVLDTYMVIMDSPAEQPDLVHPPEWRNDKLRPHTKLVNCHVSPSQPMGGRDTKWYSFELPRQPFSTNGRAWHKIWYSLLPYKVRNLETSLTYTPVHGCQFFL